MQMIPVNKETAVETLQKNLTLLCPELRDAVLNISEEEFGRRIKITYNEQDYPVCRYHRNGKSFLITSERPREEAKQWFDAVEDHKTGALFLFGCGFGYPLAEVFERKQAHTIVVLFEKDIYLFAAMLRHFDLEPLVRSNQVFLIVGEDEVFSKTFNEFFNSFRFITCTHPTLAWSLPAARNFKADYGALIQYLFEHLVLFSTFIGNDHGDNMLGFCNLVANVKEIIQSPSPCCLKDKFKDVPAFIIANGPSLDQNIRHLEQIGDRGLMISVESAILPLLRNGIRPDVLAVMERICATYHYHFEQVEFPDDLALLCLAVVDKRVLPCFRGEKIPLFRKYEQLNEWVSQNIGDGSGISSGPNVSHLALEIALHLGANPIIFVGQDLAYGPDKKTHSRDSVYSEEKGAEAERMILSRPDVFVEGNDGSTLESNQLWVGFRLELERRLAAHPDKTFLNATEGGAKIKGTKTIPLSEAIERYCVDPIPQRVNEIIADCRAQKQPDLMRSQLLNFIKNMKRYADLFRSQVYETARYKRNCKKMILLSMDREPKANWELFKETFQENNDYFMRVVNDNLFRYFSQQELFVNYFLLNQIGLIDSPEKARDLFTIQYSLFYDLNCVFQSVAAHMENADEELSQMAKELGYTKEHEDKSNKLLSVCVMVSGDEAYLPGALAEMKEIADELLVIEGEHSGRSAAIEEMATKAGAVFHSAQQAGDYGGIKNFCLDHAEGKWVLFLRAGERIDQEAKANLLELLRNPNAEGYLLNAENYPENYAVFSPVQSLRLLRNRAEYRFDYASFELVDALESGIYDAFTPIHNLDLGALSQELDARIARLEKELQQNPDDSYLHYGYGVALINRQDMETAITQLQLALAALNLNALYAPHLFKCLGWALLACERLDEALEVLNQGIMEYPFYTDLMVLRGELYAQLGKKEEALTELENCLEIKEVPDLNVPGAEIDESIISEMIEQLAK